MSALVATVISAAAFVGAGWVEKKGASAMDDQPPPSYLKESFTLVR
jgi:hypothetical protein